MSFPLKPTYFHQGYKAESYIPLSLKYLAMVLPVDGRGLYPSALIGPDSAATPLSPCIVSGYPVFGVPSQTVAFKRPGCVANRDDWNKLTMAAKLAPTNTDLQDVLGFISEWCGALPNFSF
ncbi:hypothetical protein J6590_091436 [Homalodisca vitripennis]|nr:hypothetical protein J6590_005100 [Homalodisca vitripennis]KAG8304548.1 hypothetical protein J6590_091436 [Homalodisca vitripennis]